MSRAMPSAAARAGRAAPVQYHVAMPEPASHELVVQMQVPALPERSDLPSDINESLIVELYSK